MILFSLQFILTNIIFSLIICTVLIRFNKDRIHSNLELLLYSLGLGPVFTSLLLYYFLLFSPHHSSLFYLMGVLFIFSILFMAGKRSFALLWSDILKKIKDTRQKFNTSNPYHKTESIIVTSVLILFLALFLFLYLTNTLQTPLDGTDALRYGTLGKIFFMEKSLKYRWLHHYPKTNYTYETNHAPSFSLLLTWEKITDSFFNVNKDIYYKSISTYYGLLILALILFWLSKKSKYLALLGVFTLLSGFSLFQTLITQHLDSYRIFFLCISWIFLAYAIEKRDFLSFFLLGIFSGFAAFAHTIGAVLVVFNCLTFFIFLKGNLKYKVKKTTFIIILVIAFGWIHYILDIIWGYGWIIFYREITWWG